MIATSLLRRLRGFVRFDARGDSPERFINLAAREQIAIWDIGRRGETLTGSVSASDYHRLSNLAKKTGVRLKIANKGGLPFKTRKVKKRHGLLVGVGVFAAFLFGMTRFVWSIHIVGNEQIPEYIIMQTLEQAGVSPGVARRRINVRDVEQLALLNIRELGWIALNIDGASLYVIVNEAHLPPPLVNPHAPSNIVAAYTGQIVEMRVYQGQPLFNIGQAVMAGEVVVSGISQDSFGQNVLRHARAEVIAEVSRQIEIRVSTQQTEYRETGQSARRNFIRVFGFEAPIFLPFNIPQPYTIERTENPLTLFGAELPVRHRSEAFTLMREIPLHLNEEQARDRAMLELEIAQSAQFGQAEIISRSLTGRLEGEEFVLTASYVVHMDIARSLEIYLGDIR